MNPDNQLVEMKWGSLGQLSTITKSNKKNFRNWSDHIEIELKLRGIYKAITEEDVDEISDLKARRIHLETMDPDHRDQVKGYKTAKAIYSRLIIRYAEATATRKYRLLTKFFRSNNCERLRVWYSRGILIGRRGVKRVGPEARKLPVFEIPEVVEIGLNGRFSIDTHTTTHWCDAGENWFS